jgi:hypothetical protein
VTAPNPSFTKSHYVCSRTTLSNAHSQSHSLIALALLVRSTPYMLPYITPIQLLLISMTITKAQHAAGAYMYTPWYTPHEPCMYPHQFNSQQQFSQAAIAAGVDAAAHDTRSAPSFFASVDGIPHEWNWEQASIMNKCVWLWSYFDHLFNLCIIVDGSRSLHVVEVTSYRLQHM